MKIKTIPYNDKWQFLFKKTNCEIKVSIDHDDIIIKYIGSTAVKDLARNQLLIF